MFFVKKLNRNILLEPAHLGPKMKDFIQAQIIEEVEGKCLGKHGYVLRLLGLEDATIHPGLVDNDTGCVNVHVMYQAIMLRPFKNEVLDVVVFNASDDTGFWGRVGPLEVFVHKYEMDEDMKFDHNAGDAWISEDGSIEIKEGSIVRVRIIGIGVEMGEMKTVGRIKDSYLGQLE
jgi:DNA-directed RNA polymerase II subunit RPB7